MPKKHRKSLTPKPSNTVHPSLQTFSYPRAQNRSTSSSNSRSVNDILQHLRRTQISSRADNGTQNQSFNTAPGSVHPSIRNVLALPQPPAPRPRTVQRVGGRRIRRTPGPAAPSSWLVNNSTDESSRDEDLFLAENVADGGRLRLDRLPGIVLPPQQSLQHTVLKNMALNWDWHLICDHVYLSELPTRVKMILLSYIGSYTNHPSMQVGMSGLKPLFMDVDEDGVVDAHPDVTRLDLSCALGRWFSLKRFKSELASSNQPATESPEVPLSWDQEPLHNPPFVASPIISQPSRFKNLTYLSLANPTPNGANWNSLIKLMTSLSTLTHLSLAYWPPPTTSSASPASLPNVVPLSASSSTKASSFDRNEAASVLRRLCKTTYCLKWLDLEGCSEWISALAPNAEGEDTSSQFCPEWNGSWRGIEWLGLGPGWFPDLSGEESYLLYEADAIAERQARARPVNRLGPRDDQPLDDASDSDSTDTHFKRRKERNLYRSLIERAVNVRNALRDIRRQAGGRWISVNLGPESDEERGRVCRVF